MKSNSFFMCSGAACGTGEMASELNFISCTGNQNARSKNLALARSVIRQIFTSLEADCIEEQNQYRRAGMTPSTQKSNRWATYTDKERVRCFMTKSLDFVRNHPECR